MDKGRAKSKAQMIKAVQNINNLSKPSTNAEIFGIFTQMQPQKSDIPHQIIHDSEVNRYFIKTQFNRDKQSYRSPYTNLYFPLREEEYHLPPVLRQLQEKGNILFSEYTKLYYGHQAISNLYAIQTEQGLTFGYFCKQSNKSGQWSSSNIVEIKGDPSKNVTYRLQTSILYEIKQSQNSPQCWGSIKKSRVDTKKLPSDSEIDEFHLGVVGRMIEEMETLLTQQIQSVYLNKTKDIIYKIRNPETKQVQENRRLIGKQIMSMRPKHLNFQ